MYLISVIRNGHKNKLGNFVERKESGYSCDAYHLTTEESDITIAMDNPASTRIKLDRMHTGIFIMNGQGKTIKSIPAIMDMTIAPE